MKERRLEWEFFLGDLGPSTLPPRTPPRLRGHAMARTAAALWTYNRHGWPAAQRYLRELAPARGSAPITRLPEATAVRLARREVLFCQLVTRVLAPDGQCLPRSFALAVHLNALGLPAQVIVARGRTISVPRNAFHSWTELYGHVLNDNPDVQLGYAVLQRVQSGRVGEARRPVRT
ncbi:lasso peptide biosynthesis B2 protein [Nonomuraea sp. FMUSA5-5]|uniref:Lasso peptide biosynthesis B2 protein n=1 Tax=Nonomuraea composti TaxID=2720023 RepID=A0ABX1BEW6_9ACTN|nr:lasso peptide biosynthesis B2 protein [Nonomuraea sp. FMUSA5-5]NJP96280.1 lasso peptide biosynthesis B2 protein [Nonomuraea sp. FMUSA5-5]